MKKFYLDISLLILFLLVMSFHFLPKLLHEVLGLILFAAYIFHFVWNRKSLTFKKPLFLLVDVILLICIVVTIFTGICISNHLFNGMIDMRLQRNIWIHQLHVSLPFVLLILSGLHLGMHWKGFWQRIINLLHFDIESRFYKIICRILIIGLISVGIYGSFLNQIGDRLMFQHIFATKATELPFAPFVLLMSGIFSIYVACGIIINNLKNKK